MVRSNQELKEKLFSFTITDEEVNKTNYLRTLCRQMANTVCKADAVSFGIYCTKNLLLTYSDSCLVNIYLQLISTSIFVFLLFIGYVPDKS